GLLFYIPLSPRSRREVSSSALCMAQELVDRKTSRSKTKGSASGQRRRFRPIQSAPHRKPKTIEDDTFVDESFPVVGIGASAGGLEAFTQLLRELPPDINMALVLIQHLDPTRSEERRVGKGCQCR